MPEAGLRSFEFRKGRERSWRELEGLVGRVERFGLKSLGAPELARLPVLYRATLSSLSVARSVSLDRNLLDYLENLAARAYFSVYGSRRRLGRTLSDFFRVRFPAAVRHFRRHLALAALCFLAGGVTAFVLTLDDPEWFYSFVDPAMAAGRDPSASTAFLREQLYEREGAEGTLADFSTFLFSHNSRVGMMCFALGFAAGVPVFLLLFMNGLVLGAFGALYHARGLGLDLWGWVLPHGVTELFAVVLCGAAGLVLAQSLVFPGRHGRLANLARQGREAGVLVLGAVALLFVAALIEGIFRQTVTDMVARYLVILASGAALVLYFTRAGRESGEAP